MAASRKPLTPRQLDFLKVFSGYVAENSLSPTYEELGELLRISRPSVYERAQALKAKGYLVHEDGVSRGLELTDLANQVLHQVEVSTRNPSVPTGPAQSGALSWQVKMSGKIAAGSAIEVIDQEEDIDITDLIPVQDDLYMLEVIGDSMIEDHILNGDRVLIRHQSVAENGQTVVAVFKENQSATLKRFYREKDGQIRLQPANSSMAPFYCNADEVEIRGVVTAVLRQY